MFYFTGLILRMLLLNGDLPVISTGSEILRQFGGVVCGVYNRCPSLRIANFENREIHFWQRSKASPAHGATS